MLRSITTGLLFIAALLLMSCQAYTPVNDMQAYYDGRNMAERLAKQDAIDARCYHYPALSKGMKYHREHKTRLENSKSPDFMRGFNNRYKDAFREYMELYCGNGNEKSLPLED